MERISIECINIRIPDNEVEIPYTKELGQHVESAMVAYNFEVEKVFTLKRYYRPNGTGDMLVIEIAGADPEDANCKFDMAEMVHLRNNIAAAVLPACFDIERKFTDFEIGQEVVITGAVNTAFLAGSTNRNYNSSMFVDYAKVVEIKAHAIKVELNEIPGQKETIRNPILMAPKLDVIPYLAT